MSILQQLGYKGITVLTKGKLFLLIGRYTAGNIGNCDQF